MIAQVTLQLQVALKDPTIGIGSGIAAVAAVNGAVVPTIRAANIVAFDCPPIAELNVPALLITPLNGPTDPSETQSRRDTLHFVGFEYATAEPDENKWRLHSTYVAEALMRFLDHFNANDPDYVGDSGVIVVERWSTDYTATWRDPPNALRGFVLVAEIYARDTF